MTDAIDHEHTPEIVCPHCGEKQSDSWEYFAGQTESVDIECEMCERPFHVQQFVDISYTSSKPDNESEGDDDEH